jgi:hypothetical protein
MYNLSIRPDYICHYPLLCTQGFVAFRQVKPFDTTVITSIDFKVHVREVTNVGEVSGPLFNGLTLWEYLGKKRFLPGATNHSSNGTEESADSSHEADEEHGE